MGFLIVPVVVLPGQPPIPGFNAARLGAAIGLPGSPPRPRPEVVLESFDRVLAAVLRATTHLRDADLNVRIPNRDRDLRELIHDIFYKALTWTAEGGAVRPSDVAAQKRDAARYPDVASLRRYGEAGRAALREHYSPDRVEDGGVIETAHGPMTHAAALTWIANHSAHHLRQAYWLMAHELRIDPDDSLDLAALPGITLQEALW